MVLDPLSATARDLLSVRRVFGEPYERDGVTVVPVAALTGGGGGGGGHDDSGQTGEGGGFGMSGRPVGVYVIADGVVRFRPALDVNRIVTSATALGLVALLVRARVARLRASAKPRA